MPYGLSELETNAIQYVYVQHELGSDTNRMTGAREVCNIDKKRVLRVL